MKTTLTSLLVLAAASPALLADISTGAPITPTPQAPTRIMGNCDQLASNTVRATFMGVRALQTQTFNQSAPAVVHVAVFQVIENLAYRRLVRYGDGKLKPGSCFPVSMNRELPGQPSSIVDTIAQMQPGEEVVMKIDHLYIYGDEEGKAIRPCSRMARRGGASPQPPVAAPTPVPAPGNPAAPATVAVPAPVQVSVATPTAPAPAPTQPAADDRGDDTTVEHAPQNATAAPIPAPCAPSPAPSGENF